jgi:hypothetical protein
LIFGLYFKEALFDLIRLVFSDLLEKPRVIRQKVIFAQPPVVNTTGEQGSRTPDEASMLE